MPTRKAGARVHFGKGSMLGATCGSLQPLTMLALFQWGCGRGIDPYLVGHTLYYSPRRGDFLQRCYFPYRIFLGTWDDFACVKQKTGDLVVSFKVFSLSMLDCFTILCLGTRSVCEQQSMDKNGQVWTVSYLRIVMGLDPYG